jgi:hypothetical protein
MIFEGASEQVHAVGEQRRGEGVAGDARVLLAVEPEAEATAAIEAAAARRAQVTAHARVPRSCRKAAAGGGSPTR